MITSSWHIQITSNSIYNTLLISLNNIKLNYLFINYFFACYQPLTICLKHIILVWWAIWQTTNKNLTVNNFYYGYVKIHPNLQYLGSILIFYSMLNRKRLFNPTINSVICILLISFALGSLWALFQTVWGYYWSNDTIEYVLLLFIVFSLVSLHNYYVRNFTLKIFLLTMTLFLLISLRLNLLYTKHNFFTKLKVLKYFIFFLQFITIINISSPNRLKQQYVHIKLIILLFTIIIIFFNKLNNFTVKTPYLYIMYFFVLIVYYSLIKINTNKIIHTGIYIFISIYNMFFIKYSSSLCYISNSIKSNFSLFLFNKCGTIGFNNHVQVSTFSLNVNSYLIKNYDQINSDLIVRKKICNYF